MHDMKIESEINIEEGGREGGRGREREREET